ncbi:MAG: TetR/AcrR family transcriptional regulator [Pseudomonadota bacterium]
MSDQVATAKKKRLRRSPEQARTDILNAAEELLLEIGPHGLKLMDIAERAGIGHSLINHHFGSIANLHGELALEISRRLAAEIERLLEAIDFSGDVAQPIIDVVFDVYARPENAKLVAWLLLAKHNDQRDALAQQSRTIGAKLKQKLEQSGRAHIATPSLISGIQTIATMTAIGEAIGREMLSKDVIEALPADQTRNWITELVLTKLEVSPTTGST